MNFFIFVFVYLVSDVEVSNRCFRADTANSRYLYNTAKLPAGSLHTQIHGVLLSANEDRTGNNQKLYKKNYSFAASNCFYCFVNTSLSYIQKPFLHFL